VSISASAAAIVNPTLSLKQYYFFESVPLTTQGYRRTIRLGTS